MVCERVNNRKLETTPVTEDEVSPTSFLPDYIRRAWGVTTTTSTPSFPTTPRIRLSESFSVVMTLFHCIIESRVETGDKFITSMVQARDGSTTNVFATADEVPTPRCSLEVSESDYYRSQGYYALNAAIKTSFCDGTIPRVSLRSYMERFFNSPPLQAISPSVYLLMLIYLDRASASCPGFFLNSLNVHRMLLGAFVVAAKYHEDEYVLQSQFAKHGGVTAKELCDIERTFLKAMRYRCFIAKEQFESLEIDILKEALETSDYESITEMCRNEHIDGIDQALSEIFPRSTTMTTTTITNITQMRMNSDEEFSTYLKRAQEYRHQSQDFGMKVNAHARALVSCMFPGMPVEPSEGEDAWALRTRTSRMTMERYEVYRSLLYIIFGYTNVYHGYPSMPAGWIEAFLPHTSGKRWNQEVENHSTSIAKSAVSFLLNDNDPFADLKVGPGGGVGTAAQQCGGKSLLMRW